MAILQQKSSLTYYQGWYGVCSDSDQECIDFPLVGGELSTAKKLHPQIYKIYEMRDDGLGQVSYDGTVTDGYPIHFGSLTLNKLKCGHCYRIILYQGEGNLEIPSFVTSHNTTSENKKITDSCLIISTPTPTPTQTPTPTPSPTQTPTPTPTETPTSVECCEGGKLSVRTNESSTDNLTLTGNISGTLCWTKLEGVSLPSTYLCDVNGNEIKIIITANIVENTFRFTLDTGECYEGSLTTISTEGINQFTEIN